MNGLNIKLVASDMDGTLLDSNGNLDPEFIQIVQKLKDLDIVFVAASGRQYYNLIKLFKNIERDIIFVAENGTYVISDSKELLVVDIPLEKAKEVISAVREIKGCYPVLCGKKQAYIENDNPDFVKQVQKYYDKCKKVPNLLDVSDDMFLKIAVYDFYSSSKNSHPRLKHFNNSLKVVVSGDNWLDISHQNAHKGNAMRFLQNYLSIHADECMAFGDQMNDAEMLQAVSHSYCMANSSAKLMGFARNTAPSNNDKGVLKIIEQVILNN